MVSITSFIARSIIRTNLYELMCYLINTSYLFLAAVIFLAFRKQFYVNKSRGIVMYTYARKLFLYLFQQMRQYS